MEADGISRLISSLEYTRDGDEIIHLRKYFSPCIKLVEKHKTSDHENIIEVSETYMPLLMRSLNALEKRLSVSTGKQIGLELAKNLMTFYSECLDVLKVRDPINVENMRLSMVKHMVASLKINSKDKLGTGHKEFIELIVQNFSTLFNCLSIERKIVSPLENALVWAEEVRPWLRSVEIFMVCYKI